ncbi:hypothetical protein [Paraburkholderia flagellata]|uniref:hypothetical protein n=1 Tax=Paraburkholderia flagellata TaxID=2883241 RepID=UPI001F23489D|nr:hypothetical protein [Paraburkholderia flagellata]
MTDLDELEDQLRRWCADHGHVITPDGCVCEKTAALLLGYRGPGALRMQYAEARSVVPVRRHVNGRRWYSLRDITNFLAGRAGRAERDWRA